MTIWITKYALTKGIYSVEAEVTENMAVVRGASFRHTDYFHKGEWWEAELDAKKKAEEMRKTRIASLKKSLKKMQDLKF